MFNGNFLVDQWRIILEAVLYNINILSSFDITETVLIFFIIVSFIIYWLTFIKGKGWLLYPVSIAVILIGPIIGNPPNIIQVCLFVFFHIGISVTGNLISGKRKKRKMMPVQMNTAGIGILLVGVFFSISLLFVYRITDNHMSKLFSIPVRLESEVSKITASWKFSIRNQGKVSRGNNYAVGSDKLEVTVSEKPSEVIYLKNFIGSDYMENQWEEADESDYSGVGSIYAIVLDDKNSTQYYKDRQFDLVNNIYLSESMIENPSLDENEEKNLNSAQWLIVKNLISDSEEYYTPYISEYKRRQGDEYLFSIYSEQDFLEALQKKEIAAVLDYKNIEEDYESYARRGYLNVSKERFPRIAELCNKNPLYNPSDVTEFIKNTMWSMASYTLTPGVIPLDQEIPEYFLFESGKGYCIHFATTATLMYRMYGIPARYVTGYIAKPSQFKEQDSGTYKAVLTDRQAHAWVEIYLEGLGWQKVEVTPSINQINNNEGYQEVEEEENTSTEEENVLSESVKEENQENITNEINMDEEEYLKKGNKNYYKLVKTIEISSIVIIIIGSICYAILLRRKKILNKYKVYYADKLVSKIVEVIKFGGYIEDYRGNDQEFAHIIAKTVPNIKVQDAEHIIKYAYQEAFGNKHVSLEKTKEVLMAYEKSCIFVYERLPGWKKLYFKYIKVYW
ncbi:transglutaminase-like domain-containing protein [Clostridium nigeriense]